MRENYVDGTSPEFFNFHLPLRASVGYVIKSLEWTLCERVSVFSMFTEQCVQLHHQDTFTGHCFVIREHIYVCKCLFMHNTSLCTLHTAKSLPVLFQVTHRSHFTSSRRVYLCNILLTYSSQIWQERGRLLLHGRSYPTGWAGIHLQVPVVYRGVRYTFKTFSFSRFPPVTSWANKMLAGMNVETAKLASCHWSFNDALWSLAQLLLIFITPCHLHAN